MAYEQAGIRNPRKEIHVAEVHDCFTWTEISNYEDLGLAEKGEGWKLIMEGVTRLEGTLPVNPSGGLKSFGHPIGASGIRMIAEIALQLRGEAGERQVRSATTGLAHNVGGPGAVSCVTILRNER
jgi:acetyl-CoA C-acetyltransferase